MTPEQFDIAQVRKLQAIRIVQLYEDITLMEAKDKVEAYLAQLAQGITE